MSKLTRLRSGARGWATSMSDRVALIDRFLAESVWASWQVMPMTGDASGRRYARLIKDGRSVILMDAPPENGEDTKPFAMIAKWLCSVGLCAPDILAHDPELGVMVLTDLGADDFARWLLRHPDDGTQLYTAAVDTLVYLCRQTADLPLSRMTPQIAADMVAITGEFYAAADVADLMTAVADHFTDHAPTPDTLALRDFHAENLIWRPGEAGLARVGLLDFQDAFLAPAGYDLASLLRDVRRDVDRGLAAQMIEHYIEKSGVGAAFRTQLACLGAQRNLRILGVFARLARTRGKPQYIDMIPRVWDNLMRDLDHPALARLRAATLDCLPAPDADLLQRLRA